VVCDGYRVIFLTGQALSARMVTASVVELVSGTGRMRHRGEDVEAEVPAAFGPFVVLHCEDGADEADH
jgi:hypothetical protein